MAKKLPDEGDVGLIPGSKDPMEEGMTTHFSILAWRIPWTRSLVGYIVHRVTVGHD